MSVSMRMYWKVRRRRICDAVRDCDSVQHPAQLQVAKENIMGKHKHAFSLPAEPGQNMQQRDVRGPSVLQIGPDKHDSPTNPGLSLAFLYPDCGRFARYTSRIGFEHQLSAWLSCG